jgi:hypothetical protein
VRAITVSLKPLDAAKCEMPKRAMTSVCDILCKECQEVLKRGPEFTHEDEWQDVV